MDLRPIGMVWLLAKRKRTPKIDADCLMHQAKDKAFSCAAITSTEDGVWGTCGVGLLSRMRAREAARLC